MTSSHPDFTMDLGTLLIGGYCRGNKISRLSAFQPVPRRNGPEHKSVKMTNTTRMCVWCNRVGRRCEKGGKVATQTGCRACNVMLCSAKKNDCFIRYHSMEWTELHTETETDDE